MTLSLWMTRSLVESLGKKKELDIHSCWCLKVMLVMKEVPNVQPLLWNTPEVSLRPLRPLDRTCAQELAGSQPVYRLCFHHGIHMLRKAAKIVAIIRDGTRVGKGGYNSLSMVSK